MAESDRVHFRCPECALDGWIELPEAGTPNVGDWDVASKCKNGAEPPECSIWLTALGAVRAARRNAVIGGGRSKRGQVNAQ
jgi:hypothetical protein